MHANDFRTDRHGIVSGLRDGGYSDDMTLAAVAGNIYFSRSIVFSTLVKHVYTLGENQDVELFFPYDPELVCVQLIYYSKHFNFGPKTIRH